MKSTVLVALIVLVALTVVPVQAKSDLGFKSLGIKVGFVKPEDPIDGTVGFGAQANFGTFMPNLALDGFFEFWSKSYDVAYGGSAKYSDIVIGGMVKYFFPLQSSIKPYAGAGLALHLEHASVDVSYFGYSATGSDNKTTIGFHLAGGAEMPLSPKINGFAELKYALSDINYFGIFVGANYVFGK
jgi:opacity protein-like surface antigen